MITELSISHYKSITDQTVPLSAINVLVGKNGSGKSNIVDALSFLSDIAQEDLDFAITKRHGSDSIRQWSRFKPFTLSIGIRVSNEYGSGGYRITLSSSRNSYKVVEETIEWNGQTSFSDDITATSIRRETAGISDIVTDYDDGDIDFDALKQTRLDPYESLINSKGALSRLSWIVGHLFREIRSLSTFSIFPNTIRAPQAVSRGAKLESDGSNIASILKQLPSERRRRIVRALKVVMPQLENISVKSTAGYYVPIFLVSGQNKDDTHELNMSQVSDGTLRILGMLTALFQPGAPSKVVIEEPEQMIHPALLIVIRDAILEYIRQNDGGQVFITTHSATLMDLFDVENILAVEYRKNTTSFGPISERQRKIIGSGLMTVGDVLLAEGLEIA